MRFKIGEDMSNFDDGGDDEIKKLLEVLKRYNIVPPPSVNTGTTGGNVSSINTSNY